MVRCVTVKRGDVVAQPVLLGYDTLTSRRTVADALELLEKKAGFREGDQGDIGVHGRRMPSGEVLGFFAVNFFSTVTQTTYHVGFPAAQKVFAWRHQDQQRYQMDIFEINGARVDSQGRIALTTGVMIYALEVIPVPRNEPSDLDLVSLRLAIVSVGAEERYCRRVRDEISGPFRDMIPESFTALDWTNLPEFDSPPLKQIEYAFRAKYSGQAPSREKISQALRRFGVRIPRTRKHRATI